jgi:hypothetical protein
LLGAGDLKTIFMEETKLNPYVDDNVVIKIEWADAHEKDQTWDSVPNVLEWAKSSSWIVKSVGFIVDETNEYIVLSSQVCNIDNTYEQKVGNAIKIPKGWIISRVRWLLTEKQ